VVAVHAVDQGIGALPIGAREGNGATAGRLAVAITGHRAPVLAGGSPKSSGVAVVENGQLDVDHVLCSAGHGTGEPPLPDCVLLTALSITARHGPNGTVGSGRPGIRGMPRRRHKTNGLGPSLLPRGSRMAPGRPGSRSQMSPNGHLDWGFGVLRPGGARPRGHWPDVDLAGIRHGRIASCPGRAYVCATLPLCITCWIDGASKGIIRPLEAILAPRHDRYDRMNAFARKCASPAPMRPGAAP
jgi:hypothetical protein